jgi:hypothetical protein
LSILSGAHPITHTLEIVILSAGGVADFATQESKDLLFHRSGRMPTGANNRKPSRSHTLLKLSS